LDLGIYQHKLYVEDMMKKIFALMILVSFLTCGVSLAAPTALNDNTVTTDSGWSIWGGVDGADAASDSAVLLGKMSKGVFFVGNVDTAVPLGQGYAIATKHGSGSKQYGTAHDSTAIYFLDVGTTDLGTLSDEDNKAFVDNSWTAM
jgi:hypothetical protein